MGDVHRWLSDFLALKSDLLTKPWNCWQLLTAGFAHAPLGSHRSIMHIFANMLGLFMFGPPLESRYGSKEFLRFYLLAIVTANLVWVLVETASREQSPGGPTRLLGASGAIAALVILFVMNYPHQRVYLIPFPAAIPAWVLGILIVSGDLVGSLHRGADSSVAYVVHLAGAAMGFLYFRLGIRLEQGLRGWKWPRLPRMGQPNLRIHRPGPVSDLDRRADEILEKVHQQGANSITAEERRILDEYSRKMRQKLR
jgi:membrane associated rhomboid family serine protease